jgi:hypothetical protein
MMKKKKSKKKNTTAEVKNGNKDKGAGKRKIITGDPES